MTSFPSRSQPPEPAASGPVPGRPQGPAHDSWLGYPASSKVDGGEWNTGPGDGWRTADDISGPVRDGDEIWAMLAYLGVPFISVLAPLTVYLVRGRSSDYVRQHAAQALNMSITLALYNICALILAGVLALDAVGVALAIALPMAVALWLVALGYLARAATRASLGDFYRLPGWICATIAR